MATVVSQKGNTRKVVIASNNTRKASEKVARERSEAVKTALNSEVRVDVVFEDLSLADVALIVEGLTKMRSKYRTSPYGKVYGGKAKDLPYALALVESGRADRLLAKARKIGELVAKAVK